MNDTDEAYEAVLSLCEAGHDSEVFDLLNALRRDVEVGDLLERWYSEHVLNGAGRVEGRVFEDRPGVWKAEPAVGFAGPREFDEWATARTWLQQGGHYQREENGRG